MSEERMVYGYIRVSTDKQDTENQKGGILAKAQALGLRIDDWITDDGVSGTKEPEERQLGQLLERIHSGDVIITSELSRLGRSLFMVMRILEHCMKIGAKVYTVKDNYELGNNIQSKVLAFAFSLAAEIERDMISLRTKEALARKIKLGVLVGSPRGPKKAEYVSDKDIERMTEMLNKGYPITKIAKEMKLHRLTVAYHLTRTGNYHGQIIGYKLTYANGKTIELTRRNSSQYGLIYKHIRDAVINKSDLSTIGIISAEPIRRRISVQVRDYFRISEHPDIDHDEIENLIRENLTIPEIHKRINERVDYETLYKYIQDDTDLSTKYRQRGHLKVKSQRKRF